MTTAEQDRVANALAALGTDPDEIAERLLDAECYGVSGGRSCPVAAYLQKKGFDDLYVGNQAVVAFNDWFRGAMYSSGLAELPDGVATFIDRFDGGRYEYLESTDE